VGMLTQFSDEIANNLRDMADKMTTPFLVLFGDKDPLCNISGGWELYLTSHRVRKADKASIHYLQSITTPWYFVAFLCAATVQCDEAEVTIKNALSKSFQNSFLGCPLHGVPGGAK
jgi:hypothetical protein